MKKLLLMVVIACVLPLGLHAVSKSEISNKLATAINTVKANALQQQVSVAQQQKVVTDWNTQFDAAKKFIMENSKDLLRKEDPALIDALKKLESVNNDFTNTIKTIRGTMPNAPISRLLQVANEAKKVREQIEGKSFTLPSKKDAQDLLINITSYLRSGSEQLYNDLAMKSK
jgi:hypothetical protein